MAAASPPNRRQNDALAKATSGATASGLVDIHISVGNSPAESAQAGYGVKTCDASAGSSYRGEHHSVAAVCNGDVHVVRGDGEFQVLAIGIGDPPEILFKSYACGSASEQPAGIVGQKLSHLIRIMLRSLHSLCFCHGS